MNKKTGEIVNVPEGVYLDPEDFELIPDHELQAVKSMSFKEKMRWLKKRSIGKKKR